ncbi:MAG: alkaline phosphatase family protein [Theionarchaea archaeon]|nr:alkaline phosphatase family protein [Theionarchaea archaeon]MBU7037655.1 alkaline phosphatase family protein [Theionarchaea archaeon]
MTRILVVGFDGATWDIITPLVAKHALPTFENLMEKSTWGYMESTVPPMTIPAWISLFSGLHPEQMCMFDLNKIVLKGKTVESRIFNSNDSKGKLIWDFLSKENSKSLILNIPGIFPPYPIEGHLIGLDYTPMENCTYPEDLEEILETEHDLTGIKENQKLLKEKEEIALEAIRKEENAILKILTSFSRNYSYDVIFVRFGIPDHVSHRSIQEEEMEKCHELMDTMLRTVIDSIEYDYLFLVSDHGIRKADRIFYVNRYLEKLDYSRPALTLCILACLKLVLDSIVGVHKTNSIFEKFLSIYFRGKSIFVQERLNMGENAAFAFSAAPTHFCPLYIVDKNRKEEIIEALRRNENILSIREVDCAEYGPSAILESRFPISVKPSLKEVSYESRWVHDLRAIFLAHGKNIKKGSRLDCSIYDISPTLLHVLRLPVPDTMRGKVLTEMFEENSEIAKRNPLYVPARFYCPGTEEEKIKHSVQGLKTQGKI